MSFRVARCRSRNDLPTPAEARPRGLLKKIPQNAEFSLALQTERLYPRQKRSSNPSQSMARTPQDITDAELAILQVLWEEGRRTIRELTNTLYPSGTGVHYATVQKLLELILGNGQRQLDGISIGRHIEGLEPA